MDWLKIKTKWIKDILKNSYIMIWKRRRRIKLNQNNLPLALRAANKQVTSLLLTEGSNTEGKIPHIIQDGCVWPLT